MRNPLIVVAIMERHYLGAALALATQSRLCCFDTDASQGSSVARSELKCSPSVRADVGTNAREKPSFPVSTIPLDLSVHILHASERRERRLRPTPWSRW